MIGHIFHCHAEEGEDGDELLHVSWASNIWEYLEAHKDEQMDDTQICVVMVGLPARGKSLIAQKSMRPSLDLFLLLSS
jgi:hypothetical protein